MKEPATPDLILPEPASDNFSNPRQSKDDMLEQMYEQEFNKILFEMYIQDRIENEVQRMMEFSGASAKDNAPL